MKNFIVLALSAFAFSLSLCNGAEVGGQAGVKDQQFADQIVEATLRQVEALAQSLETLEQFGKNTLEQGATVLDMGASAEPVLAKWVRSKRRDWKTRYWAADMFAYVGTPKSTEVLLKVLRDRRENRLVKERALASIVDLWKRYRADTKKLQSQLEAVLLKTKDPKLRDQIQNAILEIDI